METATIMRLPPLLPENLADKQGPFHAGNRLGVRKSSKGLVAEGAENALLALWNPWLDDSKLGNPVCEPTKAPADRVALPIVCRHIIILMTGAHFHAGAGLHAQAVGAQADGLSNETVAAIVAGQRPTSLTREQMVAYNTAAALCRGGELPMLSCELASQTFGAEGVAELIYLVCLHCMSAMTSNRFGAPIPDLSSESSSGDSR